MSWRGSTYQLIWYVMRSMGLGISSDLPFWSGQLPFLMVSCFRRLHLQLTWITTLQLICMYMAGATIFARTAVAAAIADRPFLFLFSAIRHGMGKMQRGRVDIFESSLECRIPFFRNYVVKFEPRA